LIAGKNRGRRILNTIGKGSFLKSFSDQDYDIHGCFGYSPGLSLKKELEGISAEDDQVLSIGKNR